MNQTGDDDVLAYVERPEPVPGPGQVLVQIAVAGVNFMDIGVRQGVAWNEMPNPKILGVEGAGRVLSVGKGIDGFDIGQRVAWVYAPGSYAQKIAIPATALVPIPDGIDDKTAASVMMQGLTASHFATDFYSTQPGDIAFVHAAAGGLGLLLTQNHHAARRQGDRPSVLAGQGGRGQGGRCGSHHRRHRRQVRRGSAPAVRRRGSARGV
jgi:NADPH2:quinone reductase